MPDATTQSTSASTQEHMQTLITCPKCGECNPEGTRYCENCGTNLTGVAARNLNRAAAKGGLFRRLFGRRT
jgi:hypothetical protein